MCDGTDGWKNITHRSHPSCSVKILPNKNCKKLKKGKKVKLFLKKRFWLTAAAFSVFDIQSACIESALKYNERIVELI